MTIKTFKTVFAALTAAVLFTAAAHQASAQGASSWIDLGRGAAGAGASAQGPLQFAKSKSSSKNGVQFGHGFAIGAGPNGLAISNTIGAGAGPGGVAHNLNLNIGRNGTHLSHGGVVSQGGNRRVIAGGGTSNAGGQLGGGSYASGFGNKTKAYSKSHTNRQWYGGSGSANSSPSQPVYTTLPYTGGTKATPRYQNHGPSNISRPSSGTRVIQGFRSFRSR